MGPGTTVRRMAVAARSTLAALLLLSGCGEKWAWYEVLPTTPRGQSNFLFLLAASG